MKNLVHISHLATAGKVGHTLPFHILDIIGKYRVTRTDMMENAKLIAMLVNELDGPKLREWCLVADRDYKKGDLVATFGGCQAFPSYARHGQYGFLLSDKGSWIRRTFNDEEVNVELGRMVRATRLVSAGEEFFALFQ